LEHTPKVYLQDMARTVSALADQAGLSADTVRYYERVGLLPEPGRSAAVKGTPTRSCSLSVLVEQAAKQVASLHTAAVILAQDGQPGGWV
jgi:hypothetical protein